MNTEMYKNIFNLSIAVTAKKTKKATQIVAYC